jgi:hypothetical protein
MGLTGTRSCLNESPTLHEGVIGEAKSGGDPESINQIQVAEFRGASMRGSTTMQINSFQRSMMIALAGAFAFASTSAMAYEQGYPGMAQPAGILITATAGAPPPGIYMFNQFMAYQATITGPGAPSVNGNPAHLKVESEANGLLFVPGWTFLGATYDAVIVQPNVTVAISNPINTQVAGIQNTYIVPAELSWRLGDSGFFVKTGLGIFVPDGTLQGPTGLGSIGAPFYTFQPEIFFSYLKDGWTLSSNLSLEINTANSLTGYTSGDVFHAEFQAVKSFGKWRFGPVGYYVGQVTGDTSSAYYHYAINTNEYNIWAAGALVGYDFGPANLSVYAVDEFAHNASGGTPRFPGGPDSASIAGGWKAFATLSYRLWAPDEPKSAPALYHK